MKKILWLVLTVSAFCSQAQDGYIKPYDMGLPGLVFTNMKVYGDTVVATGIGIAPPPQPPVQAIVFAKLDTNGNVLQHQVVTDSLGGNYTPGEYPRGFLKAQDGSGYVLLSHVFERKNGVAIKIDHEGKTMWIREYDDDKSRQDHFDEILELEEGYLISGSKQSLDYSNNLFVMKTDKMGNKLWEKAYGEDNERRDNYGSILEINDNEYVIGGSTGPNQGVPWQQTQTTVKIFAIDSLGNEKWYWESDPFLEELWVKGLQKMDNGNWAYATARGEYEFDGYMKRQAKFMIRDSSFNIVEERLLDDLDLGFYNYPLDLIPISNGGWLGVGANFEWVADPIWAESHVYAWMVRIDETGDTLWTRNDLTFPDTPTYASLQFLHSAVELPSGSIIAAGYYQPDGPGANLGVLIKVDKEGCLVNCSPLSSAEILYDLEEIKVFPNPANNHIYIRLPQPANSPVKWSLYNAVGEQVIIVQLEKGQVQYELSLPVLPNGLYFWEMKNTQGHLAGGKLMVLH